MFSLDYEIFKGKMYTIFISNPVSGNGLLCTKLNSSLIINMVMYYERMINNPSGIIMNLCRFSPRGKEITAVVLVSFNLQKSARGNGFPPQVPKLEKQRE